MFMFCYQCQETMKNAGCNLNQGVCGKSSQTSDLQDLLIHILKGISTLVVEAKNNRISTEKEDEFLLGSLFSTITNGNFNENWFIKRITEAIKLREELKHKIVSKGVSLNTIINNLDAVNWKGDESIYLNKSKEVGFLSIKDTMRRSLIATIIYGLKGMSAYADHAFVLGKKDDTILEFMHHALSSTLNNDLRNEDLINLIMKTGEFGVKTMALLDKANTENYGQMEITSVNIGVRDKPGILISGHDLKDLEMLLEQSKNTGIDIYTHSEMLPAHYYPYFKKYSHFAGNYGNAWWKQKEEFEKFNGPILITTNCLVPPSDTYKNRLFTTGIVGFDKVKHIDSANNGYKDFTSIIELAKTCPPPTPIEEGQILGGFSHTVIEKLADKVVNAIKSGKIRKFVIMAGCDGRMPSRKYYEDFAKALPKDTVILTAGCAKYRYNKLELGDIEGIPRVLDAGQCNNSYSIAIIALKLKEIFNLADVNDLPVVFNIAWHEQKAVLVLLSLLSLGFKNIHIGPSLPGFLAPEVAKFIIENFGLATIKDVDSDLKLLIG
ncbi:MAG: hydroxylamine reductase [Spirochaetes bacterium]|nr:hydroxylamine reductase [Spirochaetota bacterium]